MQQHKRRPTLEELKEMPTGLLRMEIAQLCVDSALADNGEVLAEAEMLAMDPDPQPEKILELWNRLRGEIATHLTVDPKIPERQVKGRMDDIPDKGAKSDVN
jgi:hypothetical protein